MGVECYSLLPLTPPPSPLRGGAETSPTPLRGGAETSPTPFRGGAETPPHV